MRSTKGPVGRTQTLQAVPDKGAEKESLGDTEGSVHHILLFQRAEIQTTTLDSKKLGINRAAKRLKLQCQSAGESGGYQQFNYLQIHPQI